MATIAPSTYPLPVRRKPVTNPNISVRTPQNLPFDAQSGHSRTRTTSSGVFPVASSPTTTTMNSQQYPQQMYSGGLRRTPTSSTSSTTGTPGRTNSGALRRSSSTRSGNSPSSYVALMRKQKATVWCDRAQYDDPRVVAQQRQAKVRKTRRFTNRADFCTDARRHGSRRWRAPRSPAQLFGRLQRRCWSAVQSPSPRCAQSLTIRSRCHRWLGCPHALECFGSGRGRQRRQQFHRTGRWTIPPPYGLRPQLARLRSPSSLRQWSHILQFIPTEWTQLIAWRDGGPPRRGDARTWLRSQRLLRAHQDWSEWRQRQQRREKFRWGCRAAKGATQSRSSQEHVRFTSSRQCGRTYDDHDQHEALHCQPRSQ